MNGRDLVILLIKYDVPIFIIIFTVLTILAIMSALSTHKNNLIEDSIKLHSIYMSAVEEHYEKIQSIIDGYIEKTDKIEQYINSGDIENLKLFVSKELYPAHQDFLNDEIFIEQLSHFSIPAVKGIIYSKNTLSVSNNVEFILKVGDINTNITEVKNIEVTDLALTLGVLLDNAIEAATESADRTVELDIYQDTDTMETIITVKNTYGQIPDIENMFRYGYSTKGDPLTRGLGLSDVKSLVDNNPHVLLSISTDDIFFNLTLSIF